MTRECEPISDYERKVLFAHYPLMAVDPYALGIDLSDPEAAKVRLSYYSHQITHFASRLFQNGSIDRIAVFADSSFGPDYPSTGQLMKAHFIKRDGIPSEKIILFDNEDQARTPTQLKSLSGFLNSQGLQGAPVLYPLWSYHEERVKNHAQGFGVNVVTAPIEELYQHTGIGYNFQRMIDRLPLNEAENMEGYDSPIPEPLKPHFSRRAISRWDKKGYVPKLMQPVLGGAYTLDNVRNPDGTLSFEYKPGKVKLKEVGLE